LDGCHQNSGRGCCCENEGGVESAEVGDVTPEAFFLFLGEVGNANEVRDVVLSFEIAGAATARGTEHRRARPARRFSARRIVVTAYSCKYGKFLVRDSKRATVFTSSFSSMPFGRAETESVTSSPPTSLLVLRFYLPSSFPAATGQSTLLVHAPGPEGKGAAICSS